MNKTYPPASLEPTRSSAPSQEPSASSPYQDITSSQMPSPVPSGSVSPPIYAAIPQMPPAATQRHLFTFYLAIMSCISLLLFPTGIAEARLIAASRPKTLLAGFDVMVMLWSVWIFIATLVFILALVQAVKVSQASKYHMCLYGYEPAYYVASNGMVYKKNSGFLISLISFIPASLLVLLWLSGIMLEFLA